MAIQDAVDPLLGAQFVVQADNVVAWQGLLVWHPVDGRSAAEGPIVDEVPAALSAVPYLGRGRGVSGVSRFTVDRPVPFALDATTGRWVLRMQYASSLL